MLAKLTQYTIYMKIERKVHYEEVEISSNNDSYTDIDIG